MDARGDITTLDAQIKLLMNREKLPEADVKALCDKVRVSKAFSRR
jgi:hypothetical protein